MRFRTILSHAPNNLHFLLGNYKYTPLPSNSHIRLLEIKPTTDRGIIECSLKAFELGNAPSFRALSYTWGNPFTPVAQSSSTPFKIHHSLKSAAFGSTSKNANFSRSGSETESSSRTPRHTIICDGQRLRVTANLRDALFMLAKSLTLPQMPRTPSYYWIDALCVDQDNVLERNAQVARMAKIFRRAQSVVVWLGKEDEFTLDAVTTIERISMIPRNDWGLIPYTSFYDLDQAPMGYCRSLTYYNWLGFIALRPWFKRAWVVQEIALAKSALVVCGSQVFSWEKLSHTLFFIKQTKWYHHLHTEKLKHVAALKKDPGIYKRILRSKLDVGISPVYLNATRAKVSNLQGGQKPSLRMLLDTHRFAKSTDPRDKVYAFLGLAKPTILTPNYNLSVQQVYTDAACALLSTYRNLSLLSHVEDSSRRKIAGLPSWVPDYSVPLDPYPLRFRGSGVWRAAKRLAWDFNASNMSYGLLDVQGFRVDSIDEKSVMRDESNDPSAIWASIVKIALSLEFPYPNPTKKRQNPSRVEVLWRTLTTDTYNKTYPAPTETGSLFIDYVLNLQIRHRLTPWSSADEFQPHHSPLSESIYPEWRTLLQLEPSESLFSLKKYRERLPIVIESLFNGSYSPIELAQLQHEFDQSGGKRRRLFKTRDGYLGTGPRSMRRGDEIWVLCGSGTPFVMRPQINGKYQLVGEAFVYGIMHGEVVDMGLPRRYITIE